MKYSSFVVASILLTASMMDAVLPPESFSSMVAKNLKPRQPNWRLEIAEKFLNGQPRKVIFFAPMPGGAEIPIKQVFYHEGGTVASESDVIEISTNDPGYDHWKSTIVPHGVKIEFLTDGTIARATSFDRGVLHGDCRSFYPSGSLESVVYYQKGSLDGMAEAYYEDGCKKKESHYVEGQQTGDSVAYYPDGARAAVIHYNNGQVHGDVTERYPDGALKSICLFENGFLQGDGKKPAMVRYDEKRNLLEVCDFRHGQPVGLHIYYHPNGKESYRVNYKNGKKDGREQAWDEAGVTLAEGQFQDGVAVGRHWRNHLNQKRAFEALFDQSGKLLKPTREFNEQGVLVRSFSMEEEEKNGPFLEWYDNGSVKTECFFVRGQFEGEQKEFFSTGQIKSCLHFSNGTKQGIQEHWYENGVLASREHFAHDLKDGQSVFWHPNGTCRWEGYYQTDRIDGVVSEWYDNGQLKSRKEFAAGMKEHWHREWDDSGHLVSEIFFERDLPHGTALVWWKPNVIRSRFHFEHGKKHGAHEWFYENGRSERTVSFSNDLMDGEWKAWYPDGSLHSVQRFHDNLPVGEHVDYAQKTSSSELDEDRIVHIRHFDEQGRLHGEQKEFYSGGKLKSMIAYDRGVVCGAKCLWNEDGLILEEAHYVDGKMQGRYMLRLPDGREAVFEYRDNLKNGLHQVYFPPNIHGEKKVALEMRFADDQLNGLAIEYNEQGQKLAETPLVNGKKEGLATFYDLQEKITTTVAFAKDLKNGFVTFFYPFGKIYRETPYRDDQRNGEERTYSESGQLVSICHYENDQLDGLSQAWNEQGILIFEGEYKDGSRHGRFNKYYDDGKPYLEQYYVADQLHGAKKKYDAQGNAAVTYYETGRLVENKVTAQGEG
jgi:antitoxin component YwqK of YwqJK toxin-antitoxin module